MNGNANNPSAGDLLTLARIADIKPSTAKPIIEQITTLAETWLQQLKEQPIAPTLAASIQAAVTQNINRMALSA